jgi:hypothetical protein
MSENDASRIIIDYSRVMLQIVALLTDNSWGIIYDCNMFIVQATGVKIDHHTYYKTPLAQ